MSVKLKTQAATGVWIVAGGHAPLPLEPAEAAFNRVARRVRLRGAGWGNSGAGIARADGLDAPWYQLGAEGIAVPGVVGDQTGPGRYRPSFPLGSRVCRGADRPSGADLRDGLAEPISCGTRMRASKRTVPPHGGPSGGVRQGRPSARAQAPVAPVGLPTINRIPLQRRIRG